MKKIILVIAASLVAISSLSVFAAAKGGPVIAIDAGMAKINSSNKYLYSLDDMADQGTTGSISRRSGSFVYGVHVGYNFPLTNNLLLGPELGFIDNGYSRYTGKTDDGALNDKTKVRSSEFNLLANLQYVFDTGFDVFVKAGVAHVKQKTSAVTAYGTTAGSPGRTATGFRPEMALGAGYQFDNGVGLSIGYKHLFGKRGDSNFATNPNRGKNIYSVNSVLATVSYSFGA